MGNEWHDRVLKRLVGSGAANGRIRLSPRSTAMIGRERRVSALAPAQTDWTTSRWHADAGTMRDDAFGRVPRPEGGRS
jgi:hypothetical protein